MFGTAGARHRSAACQSSEEAEWTEVEEPAAYAPVAATTESQPSAVAYVFIELQSTWHWKHANIRTKMQLHEPFSRLMGRYATCEIL